ncbi:MAG TPA: ABC transporter permease, partial [Chloroflexota bacterium]|nr:ABC transporter permease [Chloroflexota bacterium]
MEAGGPQGYVDYAGLAVSEPPGIPPGSLLRFENEATAEAALRAGEIEGFFIIPAGYQQEDTLAYVTAEFVPFEGGVNTAVVEWLLLTNLLGGPEKAVAVWQPLIVQVTQLRQEVAAVDEENWFVALMPTLMVFIIYMTIIIPSGMLVNSVTDEKKYRVIESVLVSVSPRQFITGKIVAVGLLGLLQISMWVMVMFIMTRYLGQGLNIPAGFTIESALLVWVVIYSLLGYAMYGVLMAGLGALVPDVKDARGASFILLLPLIVVYMFNVVIVSRPDGPVALFFSFFPLTAPVGMIGRMSATDVPMWQAVLSAGLQLGAAILLVVLVARLFHARFILSGQTFSMRRYFEALAGRV